MESILAIIALLIVVSIIVAAAPILAKLFYASLGISIILGVLAFIYNFPVFSVFLIAFLVVCAIAGARDVNWAAGSPDSGKTQKYFGKKPSDSSPVKKAHLSDEEIHRYTVLLQNSFLNNARSSDDVINPYTAPFDGSSANRANSRKTQISFERFIDILRKSSADSIEQKIKFERAMLRILPNLSRYNFDKAWLWKDWPERKSVPGLNAEDIGIDMVARVKDTNEHWAIQCKFYGPSDTVTLADLSEFLLVSEGKGFSGRLIITTTDQWASHAETMLKEQQIETHGLKLRDLSKIRIIFAPDDFSISFERLLDILRASSADLRDQGTKFEEAMLKILPNLSKYNFDEAWLWKDWPKRESITGLNAQDIGIDIVARVKDTNEYWAIQCKFYDPSNTVTHSDLGTFFTASGRKGFSGRLIITTTDQWTNHAETMLEEQQIETRRLTLKDLKKIRVLYTG